MIRSERLHENAEQRSRENVKYCGGRCMHTVKIIGTGSFEMNISMKNKMQ